MPFPFVLPTTSAFSFTAAFACPTHPSLLRTATTYRGIVRDTLKKHKRLPPETQAANLGLVVSSLQNYLPYLLAIIDGLHQQRGIHVTELREEEKKGRDDGDKKQDKNKKDRKDKKEEKNNNNNKKDRGLGIEWRPTLSESRIPGRREAPRVRLATLDQEAAFVLATLGHAHTLLARAALQPLYVVTSVVPVSSQQRTAAITTATRHLLEGAGVFSSLEGWVESKSKNKTNQAIVADISPSMLRALASLALAEATLLAVLKDDPYPAAVAQGRNEHDREWMYKAPDIPKVRAHLFARLCLAAAEHASQAAAGASTAAAAAASIAGTGVGSGGVTSLLLSAPYSRYLQDLQHTSRAKACRFFAIDAELGNQTGVALAWIHAAQQELSAETGGSKAGLSTDSASSTTTSGSSTKHHLLSRFKKERSEKREDRRVERGQGWGADAGLFEERRVLEMLDAKWTKQNDTINTQRIPPAGPLLAQMPSGREIHTVKPYELPVLDATTLEDMRALPDTQDEAGLDSLDDGSSSDDEALATGIGAYPTSSGSRNSYY